MNQSYKVYIKPEDVCVNVVEKQENILRQNEQRMKCIQSTGLVKLEIWVNFSFAKLVGFVVFKLIVKTPIEWLEYIFYQIYIACEIQEWLSDKEYLGLNLRRRLSVVPGVT